MTDAMNPIQAAEDVLAEVAPKVKPQGKIMLRVLNALSALLTHARTLEAELARLREPQGDGAELVAKLTGIANVLEGNGYSAPPIREAAAFITRQSAEIAELRAGLREMIYEITHLCPMGVHGEHRPIISAEALAKARALAAQDGGA